MNKSSLNISIVTYETDERMLLKCINCILESSVNFNIFIIDNSPLDILRGFCMNFKCQYIHNPSNPGYGAAHNIAIIKSLNTNTDYHLVLNADVYFQSDVLGLIVDFMDENPNVGHLMPKTINPDGSLQRLCKLVPTPIDLILRRFFPKRFSLKMQRNFELWDSGYNKITFVPYLSGCFMFLRCSVLKDIGIFDENFFMYPEDIDLTRRIAVKYDTIFYPEVFIIHDHGAASYKSYRMLVVHVWNIFKYFNKWGWIFDFERSKLNNKTLKLIQINSKEDDL